MSLQLHHKDGKGGLEPHAVTPADHRPLLRSPRWGTSLPGGKLPSLKNPEMNPTSVLRSVLFWLSLAGATFVLIWLGYGTGFWTFAS